jgi:hypothetical protein
VIAVYDFGGGTFDATILRKTDDGFEPLGQPEGLERLGGIDFDEALFRRAMGIVTAAGVTVDTEDPATMAAIARLRDECRRAKEALSSDTDATVPIFLPGLQTEMRVTRAEFEDMIRPRIHETVEALGRATRSAGLELSGLDRILLVGGSSRIPLVAEMVRESTGRPVAVDAHPKHTMALGAAYVAENQRVAAVGAAPAAAVAAPIAEDTDVAAPAPDAATPPPAATGGVRARPLLPIGLAIAGVAVVAAVALGASGILGGAGTGGPSASPSQSLAVVASASPSPAPTPSPTPVVTPSPTPTPTPEPTPTPTPPGRQARITGITVSGGRYVVDYQVFDIVQDNDAEDGKPHVHFFFDTVPPEQAGHPGKGPWWLYDGPVPFMKYRVSDKPSAARQMCVLVANGDHSVIQRTGNCVDLPQ